MKYIDQPFVSPAENLAFDEALLEAAEAGEIADDLLVFWEGDRYFVVIGYANRLAGEVNVPNCLADQIPIHRRASGGGTVLQGPGCLNYSVILRISDETQNISATNRFVMERQRLALQSLLTPDVEVRGHTDLTLQNLKFSGNAQRRRRTHLIFHGSFLLNMDLAKIEKYLRMPSQEPDYRAHRTHRDFVTNLGLSSVHVKNALCQTWNATAPAEYLPLANLPALVQKYSGDDWNLKF